MTDALALLQRYADRDGVRTYDPAEHVPLDRVVPAVWRDVVVDEHGRVQRVPYELCALGALREAIRRREVWIVGARRWRDPKSDLPPGWRGDLRGRLRTLGTSASKRQRPYRIGSAVVSR